MGFSLPAVATLLAEAFVPVRFSMVLEGPGSDPEGRELVNRTRLPGKSRIRPPDLLVLDPDANLLAQLPFDASAEETLGTLRGVLAARPDLAPPLPLTDPAAAQRSAGRTELLSLEARWRAGERGRLVRDLELWLEAWAGHSPDEEAAALNLLGAARYHAGEFAAADRAWAALIEKFPNHSLVHRAQYNRLDARSWLLAVSPDLEGARHPFAGIERPVVVPNREVRDRNLLTVEADPRYSTSPSGLRFVRIPAGVFTMGATDPKFPRELPLRRVTLSRSFRMSAWPVTRGLWRRFRPEDAPVPIDPLADELPMAMIPRDQAVAFLAFLSDLDGERYRFPTEAEWEYAARGGIEGAAFPWGHEPPDSERCNYEHSQPVPVASYPPNGFGLFEMVGNVQEWTADAYSETAYSRTPLEVTDPWVSEGDEGIEGGLFVARGASPGLSFCLHYMRTALRVAAHRASIRVVASEG